MLRTAPYDEPDILAGKALQSLDMSASRRL